MASLNTQPANEVPYHPYPCGKALAMEFRADFVATDSFDVDLTNAIARKFIDACESLYIDNFGNAQRLTFNFGGTNQRIICPAGAQMYVPVLCSNPAKFSLETTGAVPIRFFVLNFPVPMQVWIP